ncbi:MAG: DNA translocase FtsK [Candidatus Komeilibacteria bacterium]|jgi:DNA segregation ATPase FtsK/SpoIIIE, S-DNA-T family|nr:DNA translocase FtsK [Candidatus Komeilibacteria bacterium]
MARRKKRDYYEEDEEFLGLNPETKKAIFIILIFTLAILSVLSIFDMTGAFGRMLNFALSYVFGLGVWLFIVILLWLGYLLIRSGIYGVRIATYIGLFLILLSFSGILHYFVRNFTFSEISKTGSGGGALGYLISNPAINILGFWGTLVILLAILFIGVFLSFNTSFADIIAKAKALGIIKEKFLPDQEFEEEEEEQEFEVDEVMEEEEEEQDSDEEEEEEQDSDEEEEENDEEVEVKKPRKKIVVPVDLLSKSNTKPDSGDVNSNMNKIQKTFENFGIEVEMADVNVGPTVTQYTLRPAEGVRLSQMLTLQNDLALALAAHPLRMEAPIPGKSLVGVEVPNQSVSIVKLREILESNTYKKRKNNLHISLGKDVAGNAIMGNLATMPHLLIAGSTGSGKSVCINNVILSLIYQNSPDQLKFILIDPKRVELSSYNDIPHLLTPVINDTDKAINALRWVVNDMHERYKLLQAAGKRNIESYNKAVIVNKIPYIVVIVDEFAALMSLASKEIEAAVVSLAQMARAVGIHLVLATQRPSVDVITGLIKANITSRIAFAVASSMDSRTIIDTSGAEKLLGKGDMLFMTAELSKARRIQGAYVSDEEINDVVAFIKDKEEPEYNESIVEKKGGAVAGFGGGGDFDDDLTLEAKEVVIKAGKASATLLQRRLRVGYARAARLLDILEEMGIVGPSEGSKAREVLISQDELEENFDSVLDEEEVESEELDGELEDSEDDEGVEYEEDEEEDK